MQHSTGWSVQLGRREISRPSFYESKEVAQADDPGTLISEQVPSDFAEQAESLPEIPRAVKLAMASPAVHPHATSHGREHELPLSCGGSSAWRIARRGVAWRQLRGSVAASMLQKSTAS